MKRSHLIPLAAVLVCLALVVLYFRLRPGRQAPVAVDSSPIAPAPAEGGGKSAATATRIYAHNLRLRKGPDFRIYIRWLNGELIPTRKNVHPSFDDTESFVIEIKRGVIHANVGDISHYLNTGSAPSTPLKNIALSGDGDKLSLHGTLHKMMIPLPVELDGTISAAADSRIHLHVDKLSVLKLPLKGLLGGLHITVADLMKGEGAHGIEASGDEIYLDTQEILPPPHIHGKLTSVRFANPDIEVIYGDAQNDEARTAQWHNFLRLAGGTLNFGKITMHDVDLTMIDASKEAWFDLDLVNYQAQVVNGYTRMTPKAGLEIFMPQFNEIQHNQGNQTISAEWLKNRNLPPPPDVPVK